MAKNETRRLAPSVLAEDEAAFNALQKITGYVPADPAYTIEAGQQKFDTSRASRAAEDQAAAALATARDVAARDEWAVHNWMLGVKDQVRAKFGKDSAEVQEIGLKRKSEYKTRRPKSTPKTT